MSVDPNLAIGDTDTGATTFGPVEGSWRIIAVDLGSDSAVLGVSPKKSLVVVPHGDSNPLGVWKTNIIDGDGYAFELVGSTTLPQSGPLYANTTDDDNKVVLGPTRQKFIPFGAFGLAMIQDPKTKLVWELTRDGNSGDTYVITMKEKDPKETLQLWGFKSSSLL